MDNILLCLLGLVILATILIFGMSLSQDNPIQSDYQPDYYDTFGR